MNNEFFSQQQLAQIKHFCELLFKEISISLAFSAFRKQTQVSDNKWYKNRKITWKFAVNSTTNNKKIRCFRHECKVSPHCSSPQYVHLPCLCKGQLEKHRRVCSRYEGRMWVFLDPAIRLNLTVTELYVKRLPCSHNSFYILFTEYTKFPHTGKKQTRFWGHHAAFRHYALSRMVQTFFKFPCRYPFHVDIFGTLLSKHMMVSEFKPLKLSQPFSNEVHTFSSLRKVFIDSYYKLKVNKGYFFKVKWLKHWNESFSDAYLVDGPGLLSTKERMHNNGMHNCTTYQCILVFSCKSVNRTNETLLHFSYRA